MSRPRPGKSQSQSQSHPDHAQPVAPVDAAPDALRPIGPSVPVPSISVLMLRDATGNQFAAFCAELFACLDPTDLIGRLLAELLVMAVERLRRAARLEPEDALPSSDWCRFQALAERNARAAAKELARHLERPSRAPAAKPARASSASPGVAGPAPVPKPEPEPAPVPESTPEEIAEASAHWRRHIALVRGISEEWPILLRTGREVEAVAAWFGDGKSDDELMRWYPDVSRADLAACRACDAEGLCGPFDPADGPYPPGLPVLDDLPADPPE
ncbi:DUF433 domain-containing protein [Tautonia plasticadhaerens]|uniref:DUF433 domain-containing protein n=1 Tax=Tautonia plasticadhaerens TaxID=2527974 RepID=A0A518H2W6_9BACT|nr:DUF433 domain-containing protein [Tautonia plasticadhaerens]QDV35175.1 hypothetical protein ElP_30780 [Tautonia plasticadhaerens]